jgi:hypothetical protein
MKLRDSENSLKRVIQFSCNSVIRGSFLSLPTEKQSKSGLANYMLDMNRIVRCSSADVKLKDLDKFLERFRNGRTISSRQKHSKANHEKGESDQDRQAKKISKVAHPHNARKENGASQMPARRFPDSLADFLTSRTKEIGLSHR